MKTPRDIASAHRANVLQFGTASCAQAEWFPWYLNGTLEADRAREVEAHIAICATCGEHLLAMDSLLRLVDQHPSSVDLALWIEDRESLSAAQQAEIGAHVDSCGVCASLVPAPENEIATLRPFRRPAVRVRTWLAIAASLLVIVFLASQIGFVGEDDRSASQDLIQVAEQVPNERDGSLSGDRRGNPTSGSLISAMNFEAGSVEGLEVESAAARPSAQGSLISAMDFESGQSDAVRF